MSELPVKNFLCLQFTAPVLLTCELLEIVLKRLVKVHYSKNGIRYHYTLSDEDDHNSQLVAYKSPFDTITNFPGSQLFSIFATGGYQEMKIKIQTPSTKAAEWDPLAPGSDFTTKLIAEFRDLSRGAPLGVVMKQRIDWSAAIDLIASRSDLVKVYESANILSTSKKAFAISERQPSDLFTYENGWSEMLEVDLLDLPHGQDIAEILREIFRTTNPSTK